MSTPHQPDPVNRWATEHYGFPEHATTTNLPTGAAAPTPTAPPPRRRRTAALIGSVLGLALVAGLGGVAVAGVGDEDGSDGGSDRGRGTFVQTDDVGGDGRVGGPGGGRR